MPLWHCLKAAAESKTFISIHAMTSNLTAVLTETASTGKYLSNSQLSSLQNYFQSAERRLDIGRYFTNNSSKLVSESLRQFILKRPSLVASGGLLGNSAKLAACIRDLDLFLRFISYCVLANDSTILDEQLLNGLREKYMSLDIPINLIVDATRCLHEETVSKISEKFPDTPITRQISGYFDRIQSALA